ncbi:MAG: hypothetical protein L6V84_05235 [Oscillospiraceae bacterium]|nr:MAG: hypothetical protein L6V84_05235 [Oscillospiraceae bacterium]
MSVQHKRLRGIRPDDGGGVDMLPSPAAPSGTVYQPRKVYPRRVGCGRAPARSPLMVITA